VALSAVLGCFVGDVELEQQDALDPIAFQVFCLGDSMQILQAWMYFLYS